MILSGVHVRGIVGGLLWFCLSALPSPAWGQLQAGPTLLEIAEGGSTELLLRNTGDEDVAAQVRVYAWSQPGGEDQLVPSDAVAISPPIAELAPATQQIVRLVRIQAAPSDRDGTYRIVVDELPRDEASGSSRVALRMRYVIPLFVRAPGAAPPSLTCGLEEGGTRLACDNSGGRAAQLGASRLVGADGGDLALSEGLFGYVLPANRRIWTLTGAPPGGTLRLETRLNGQATTLPVSREP